jgi:hypothetical protein
LPILQIRLGLRAKGKDKFDFPQDLSQQLNPTNAKKKKIVSSAAGPHRNLHDSTLLDESDDCEATEATIESPSTNPSVLSTLPSEEEDLEESLLGKVNNASFKTDFSDAHNSNLEETRYALVTDNAGNTRTVLKQTITWLLENSVTTRSSERLIRVKQPASTPDLRHSHVIKVEKSAIQQGDWCVFETIERDDYLLGRIEVLTHVNGRTNERFVSEWRWDEAGANCDVQTLCSWFTIQRSDGIVTGKLEETPMISNGYFPCKYYVCSVPMPILDEEKSLRLSESTTDQLNLFLNLLEK